MKTVFSNQHDLVKAWAHGSSPYGRAGNVSFDGDSLFSYATEVMRLDRKNEVLFESEDTFSPSTGQQMSIANRAVPGWFLRVRVFSQFEGSLDCTPDGVWARHYQYILGRVKSIAASRRGDALARRVADFRIALDRIDVPAFRKVAAVPKGLKRSLEWASWQLIANSPRPNKAAKMFEDGVLLSDVRKHDHDWRLHEIMKEWEGTHA